MRVQLLGELVHTYHLCIVSSLRPKAEKTAAAAAVAFSFLSYNRKKVAQLRPRARAHERVLYRDVTTLKNLLQPGGAAP